MKETKVYVDELPKSCVGCKCFAEHRRQCELELCFQWSEEEMKYNDCPLKLLHDHDKELVAKVCEKIKKYLFEKCDFDYGYYLNEGDFTIPDLFSFLDQIQKEFEDENNKN